LCSSKASEGEPTIGAKVIVGLNRRGNDSLHAVENPLTFLADDAERTQEMASR
jgi:hypothetical protein